MEGTMLTVNEVAALLRVHTSTIYRMLKYKELPAFRVGSDWRFRSDELERFLNKKAADSMAVTNPNDHPSRKGRHPAAT